MSAFRIYNILDKTRVPHYLQDKPLQTIGEEIYKKYFHPYLPEVKQKAFLKEVCKHFKTAEPIVNVVALATPYTRMDDEYRWGLREEVEVITFDFEEQLNDLLSDTVLFGNVDNLVINLGREDK
jgi:hypothetical protein